LVLVSACVLAQSPYPVLTEVSLQANPFGAQAITCALQNGSSFTNVFRFTHQFMLRQFDVSGQAVVSLLHQSSLDVDKFSKLHTVVLLVNDNSVLTYLGYQVQVQNTNTGDNNIGSAKFLKFLMTPAKNVIESVFSTGVLNPQTQLTCSDIKADFSAYGQDPWARMRGNPAQAAYLQQLALQRLRALPPNCRVPSANGQTCVTCVTGYYLSSQACVPQKLDNCVEYWPDVNDCKTCATNYVPSFNGCMLTYIDCTKRDSGVCSCPLGYKSSATTFNCVASQVPNCKLPAMDLTYNSYCQVCINGFTPIQDAGSTTNYFLCTNQILMCKKYDPVTFKCIECLEGTLAADGLSCKITPPNPSGANLDTCTRPFYYVAETKTCAVITATFCATYAANFNECETCMTGYAINEIGFCQRKAPNSTITVFNCQNPATGSCSTCNDGYFLRRLSCAVIKIPNCLKATFVTTAVNGRDHICTECSSGYTLSPPTNSIACVS